MDTGSSSSVQTDDSVSSVSADGHSDCETDESDYESRRKEDCYEVHSIDGKTKYICLLCRGSLSSKQRILHHLASLHGKSPVKRIRKLYVDNPHLPVPKRTLLRRKQSSQADDIYSCGDAGPHCEEHMTEHSQTEHLASEEPEIEHTLSSDSSDDESIGSQSSSSSYLSSDNDTDTESEKEENEPTSSFEINKELRSVCILSYLLRHNLTKAAGSDLLKLLQVLHPECEEYKALTINGLSKCMSNALFRTIHYCSFCFQPFPDDESITECVSDNCDGLRYKDEQSKVPNACFLISNIKQQMQELLLRTEIKNSIEKTKRYVNRTMAQFNDQGSDFVITDITDGQEYRKLCQPGAFLSSETSISCIFNTDGVPLYKSSKVSIWPIFLAINELDPSLRFRRNNILLAAIWQGKHKPPFNTYISAFGESMTDLYYNGVTVGDKLMKVAVILGTFDLQAKAYTLNMTMHNGSSGCITCYETGKTVVQGRGHARCYPYREDINKPIQRSSAEVKSDAQSTDNVKNGIKGPCGLTSMPWFDTVRGIVPDYMHGILMGITKCLLLKFISPSNAGKPYFVGNKVKLISKCLRSIKPPDFVERLPRDLEAHYQHLKATELQTWLIHYSLPCLRNYLPEKYLWHLALLSEACYILLGEYITKPELDRAANLLDLFYQNFAELYGEGSQGLNVHNAGAHLADYVRMWGPLYGWSCFGFEDANAHILGQVHGTGDIKQHILNMKSTQGQISILTQNYTRLEVPYTFLRHLNQRFTKKWKCTCQCLNCEVAGALHFVTFEELDVEKILQNCGSNSINDFKEVLRVQIKGTKYYSFKYTKLKNRISHVILTKDGEIVNIQLFLLNTLSQYVYLYGTKLNLAPSCFMFTTSGHHITQVVESEDICILPVSEIREKLFYIKIDNNTRYVSRLPNLYGHGVLK